MTKKERVYQAIQHKNADIVPYHVFFTIPALEKTQKYYNDIDLESKIGNHLLCLNPFLPFKEIKKGYFRDEFGVVWNKSIDEDIGNPENCVIQSKADLDELVMPTIKDDARFNDFKTLIKKNNDQFVLCDFGFSLFERAWTMRGMENVLCDMACDGKFIETFLDRLLEWDLNMMDYIVKYDVDGIFFGDDWGQQQGLIMGPAHWRKYIKPRIAKLYARAGQHEKMVFIHSCGDIEEILPDLIEAGVDVLNPFQPEAFDIYKIKKSYGDKISFFGGMSTQKVLPFGSPEDVRKETRKLLKEIGNNGGYIFSPAHSIPKDVSVENMVAMLEVLQNQR